MSTSDIVHDSLYLYHVEHTKDVFARSHEGIMHMGVV
jgi:hypothetical protein